MGTDKVLVSGSGGWLGRALVDELVALPSKLHVRALLLNDSQRRELPALVEPMLGDICNPQDCIRFCSEFKGGILFHTAGVIHPRRVREFYEVNVEGTKNLLNAACAAGVRRAVVVSSNSVCGCNPHPDHLFDEKSPHHPYLNYGRSKMLMELAVREFQKNGLIETVIIRAPWFYGPYQPPRQTLFFKMIRDGNAPIVGDGNNLRSMAYLDNLTQGLILAAASATANGQVYWIADERPYSMNEIVDTVEKLLEKEFGQKCAHRRLRLPGMASDVAWLVDNLVQGAGFYHQKIHVLSEMNKTIACSIAKATADLGYKPLIALEDGMRRSLRWCFETGYLP